MRRDRGATLVELTVVIAIIGVIVTAVSGGIVVLLRSNPVVSRSIGQSHDQQQLLNYLYEDVRATQAVDVNTSFNLLGYTRDPNAPGCAPAGSAGPNALQLTWRSDTGLERSSYRLVDGADGALLQRDHCAIAGVFDAWPASPPTGWSVATVNVADRLDPRPADWDSTGPPAHVTVDGEVLTMFLTQQGRELRASATLRSDLALIPSPPGTTPPSTTAVPTTTTVPEPTTTTTTTTTTTAPETPPAAETTTTTTSAAPAPTTLPPVTVPTVGQGQPLNPLAAAQGFSMIAEGDVALRGVTVDGGVAAGGNASFATSASVATASAASVAAPGDASSLGLMVGGALDLGGTPATALTIGNGFAHAGSLPGAKVLTSGSVAHIVPTAATDATGTPRASVTGADQADQTLYPVVRPGVFPFTNTFLAFDRSSTGMAALTPTNCPAGHPTDPPQPALEFPELYQQSGNWVLNLVAGTAGTPTVNVLNITEKQLDDMTVVNGAGASGPAVVPDANTAVVINVTDHGTVSVDSPSWPHLVAGRAQSVVWNFPNANRVTVSGTLYGTVFAPVADVTLAAATVRGDVVAGTLTTSPTSSVEVAHFDQHVPCIG